MQKLCEILIELYIEANSSPNRVGREVVRMEWRDTG